MVHRREGMKTKNYSAILVDDEKPALDVLTYLIKMHCPEITVSATFQNPSEAEQYILRENPDLAFIDIRMNQINGLDFINSLENSETKYILTTAYHQYAMDAWKSPAVSYLLKPVDPEDLILAIDKIKKLDWKENTQSKQRVNLGSESVILDCIISVTAAGAYSHIILKNYKKIVLSKNLKSILNLLDSKDFYRVHRSHIINVNHITSVDEINRVVVLTDKVKCEISERKLSDFLIFFNNKKNGRD